MSRPIGPRNQEYSQLSRLSVVLDAATSVWKHCRNLAMAPLLAFSRLRASHPLYPSPDVYTRRCNVETHPMQPFTKPVSSTAMSANQLTDSYYCFLEYHAVSISMRATGRK